MTHTNASPASSLRRWIQSHRFWSILLAVIAILAVALLLLNGYPFHVDDTSVSDPATSYDEATARIEAIRSAEIASGELNEVCYSNALTHGAETDKVIVFYHGFTSCPEQFRELGEQFHALGYNVFIPRMPHHGHADQLSDALIGTTSEELAAFATETIDIARGLGRDVSVAGLSGGGAIATWIAQRHGDVEEAVMIAPFLGIGFVPAPLNRTVARIADDIPNIWMWWDPSTKADNPNTAFYSYPRYPLHALAEYLRLGFAAQQDARRQRPDVDKLVIITNANDNSVNNTIVNQFSSMWASHSEDYVRTFEFEKALNLPHDLITPDRANGDPALVYPILIENITESE